MKVLTEIGNGETSLVIEINSRDDLERMIKFLPTVKALFPYPEPPADPKPGDFEPGRIPAPI